MSDETSNGDPHDGDRSPTTPLSTLGLLAIQEVEIAPGLTHIEMYTRAGLLTMVWHGDQEAEHVLLTCGGAMGSLLGPADGMYHDLGVALAERGIGTIRVGYRQPNDLQRCIHDVAAAAQVASGKGATRFVVMGHSFGGAVAVSVGAALPGIVSGVVGLASQSAGCEHAPKLAGRHLLLIHGDQDEILPPMCSYMVRDLAGMGEVRLIPGASHLLRECKAELRQMLLEWVPATLAQPIPDPPA